MTTETTTIARAIATAKAQPHLAPETLAKAKSIPLLSIGADAKTSKGQAHGVLTGICYLAPAFSSGVINTCPWASKGCTLACLYTAGHGAFDSVKVARIGRTHHFAGDRTSFMAQLVVEIGKLIRKAAKLGMTPAVRLNGTSDIPWESILHGGRNIMEIFPTVAFYDYSKSIKRVLAFTRGEMPANYHLTLSRSESNQGDVAAAIAAGANVAAVFSGTLPATWHGRPVINGDLSDLRFRDPAGVIVGLRAKGQAKRDTSGFVIQSAPVLAQLGGAPVRVNFATA